MPVRHFQYSTTIFNFAISLIIFLPITFYKLKITAVDTNVKSRLSLLAVAALTVPVLMWCLGFGLVVHVMFHVPISEARLSFGFLEASFAYFLLISFAPVGIFLSVSALLCIRRNTDTLYGLRYAIEGLIISILLLLLSAYLMFYFFRFLPDFHVF